MWIKVGHGPKDPPQFGRNRCSSRAEAELISADGPGPAGGSPCWDTARAFCLGRMLVLPNPGQERSPSAPACISPRRWNERQQGPGSWRPTTGARFTVMEAPRKHRLAGAVGVPTTSLRNPTSLSSFGLAAG